MTYQKILFSGLAGLGFLAVGACTSDDTITGVNKTETKTVKSENAQTGYLKPGASVEFSHTYDGKTNPGEVENFQVFLKGGSLKGSVDLKMENDDGLSIYSNSAVQKLNVAKDAPSGLDHAMDISVGAQAPGRYYLKFFATSDQGGDEPMMRSFAIAIQVGDQPYVPKLGKGMTAEETPTGEKIITMEAEETIEN